MAQTEEQRRFALRKLYDSFDEPRNMTWEEFYKEMTELTDPAKMLKDLEAIQGQKALGADTRRHIDVAIRAHRNKE